jgi:uncharacterized membrane protein
MKKRGRLASRVRSIEAGEKVIEEKEVRISKGVEREFHKEEAQMQERIKELKRFSFADYAQSLLGVGVWGISVLINPDIWIFTNTLNLAALFVMHLYFLVCFMVVLNYQYRHHLTFDKVFLRSFLKRVFLMYFSVLTGVLFLLFVTNKFSLSASWDMIFHSYLVGQSVGLMGAATFSFFKEET